MTTATKIEKMDRNTCKMIRDNSEAVLKELAKSMGLEISYNGGTFSEQDFTMKVRFAVPVKAESFSDTLSQEQVNYGLAPRGSKVKVGSKTGVIEMAKRAKYVVIFDDKPGVRYVVRFTSCQLI